MKHFLLFFIPLLLLPLLGAHADFSAPHTITGQVVDAQDGSPLVGANVLIKGSSRGTITDVDGRFTLSSADSCLTLQVSYTGYQTVTQPNVCAGQPALLRLNAGAVLQEVVVVSSDNRKPSIRREVTSSATSYSPSPSLNATAYTAAQDDRTNGEGYAPITENHYKAVSSEPLSTLSIDVDRAAYSNVRRFIQRSQLPPTDAVRVEEMINYFNYSYPEPSGEHPVAVYTELSDCPWQPAHKLLHVGMRGKRIPAENLPVSNLVFLLDVSGSMGEYNKLPLLKESLKLLVNNLRPEDQVAIVVYAGAAGLVLPSTSGANKQKILDALDELQSGGSTAGEAGIRQAYQVARQQFMPNGNNRVILATDGDFNVGVSSEQELLQLIEQERGNGIFLTVLGFGTGNYQDAKMQLLADHGNGNHAYIDDIAEARKVLVQEFGGTLFTIAKDVKIQIAFNPALVQGYRLVGYENRLLANEDFSDDTKDAGELGAGHTVTALYEIIPAGAPTTLLDKPDSLKAAALDPSQAYSGAATDFAQVRLRYKQPDGDTSTPVSFPVSARQMDAGQSSLTFRWAAAVAEFGLLLRNSEHKGTATYEHCLSYAQAAKGSDPNGYRQEMIDLITKAQSLSSSTTAR